MYFMHYADEFIYYITKTKLTRYAHVSFRI